MSEENYGLSSNPMFGAMIGQQIANNRLADMNARHASDLSGALEKAGSAAIAQGNAAMGIAVAAVALKQQNIDLNNRIDELEKEVLDLESTELGLTGSLAGVRGVTRELLSELRKSDPNNPLLDKKTRDKIFDSNYDSQIERQKNTQRKQRKDNAPKYRDIAYGAEGSNKGGPEKSQITSNTAVRAEAQVPEHVTDRERFMSLIKELQDEVAKYNPKSPLLREID